MVSRFEQFAAVTSSCKCRLVDLKFLQRGQRHLESTLCVPQAKDNTRLPQEKISRLASLTAKTEQLRAMILMLQTHHLALPYYSLDFQSGAVLRQKSAFPLKVSQVIAIVHHFARSETCSQSDCIRH